MNHWALAFVGAHAKESRDHAIIHFQASGRIILRNICS